MRIPRGAFAAGAILGLLLGVGGAPSPAALAGESIGMTEVAAAASPAAGEAEAGARAERRALRQKCVTNASTGFTRADVSGAASNNQLAVLTNVSIGVYRRSDCGVISRTTLKSFFAGLGLRASDTLTEPRVIFDFDSKRFFVAVISHRSGSKDQSLYYAVSTNSAGAAWHRGRIVLSQGTNFVCKTAANSEWFFANAGVNKRRWFVTANNFPASGVQTGAILSLDKAQTLVGQPAPFKCFKNLPDNLAPPIVRDSATFAYFLSTGRDSGNAVRRRLLNTSGGIAADTLSNTANIAIPAWQTTGAQFAEQSNGCTVLVGDGRFASASIQIGASLWNVHTINDQGLQQARWRLYKLSTFGTTPLLVHTPNSGNLIHHSFHASVATGSEAAGRLAFVTYTRIVEPQPALPAGERASMLMARGPNDATTNWSFVRIVRSAREPNCEIFDPFVQLSQYSATQIDPQSHELFPEAWGFNQLTTGPNSSNWNTRAARVN